MTRGYGRGHIVVDSSDEDEDVHATPSADHDSDESEPVTSGRRDARQQKKEADSDSRRRHKRARASSSDSEQSCSLHRSPTASTSQSRTRDRDLIGLHTKDNVQKGSKGSAKRLKGDTNMRWSSSRDSNNSQELHKSSRRESAKKSKSRQNPARCSTRRADSESISEPSADESGHINEQRDDSDEDDLSLSGQETIQPSRLRPPSRTTSKFAALRALRQGKAKATDDGHRAKVRNMIVISDSDDDESSENDNRLSRSPRDGVRRYLGSQARDFVEEAPSSLDSDLDRDDEEFIVEGSDNDEDAQVVAEFREKISTGAQGQMYYLKTYLLWLVHTIVCPDVDWLEEDETFRVAERAVTNRLQDLLRALIGSSAWRRPFKKALEEKPEQTTLELNAIERGGPCEACTMGRSRHSSLLMLFYGQRYDRHTFQDAEIGSDDDGPSVDSGDEAQDTEARHMEWNGTAAIAFNVGSSCAGRASIYHELHHWAYTTHHRMTTKLDAERSSRLNVEGATKAERRKLKREAIERDRKEADRCAAVLDAEGTISDFARQLDDEIKRAVNAFARAD
ncbi:hypothetical protein OIV83_000956 [Microbotryomycetes sp. JL201]|nr:hypothetical protein OIV83_000956 [Microbotryomycetes sp. JL201]